LSNALAQISKVGTSIWLDDLSRSRLVNNSGNPEKSLLHLTRNSHVVGVTTNPAIFANALKDAETYRDAISALRGKSADDAIRLITTEDVRIACDQLQEIYEKTSGVDGRVSIEVDPRLAHEEFATIKQAKELWSEVDRKNLFIKVPATKAGLPAITALIREGISVNVTLIFSLERYREVLLAYLDGLEARIADGQSLTGIQSVASFFVSRVDSAIDPVLDGLADPRAKKLRGAAAVANARLAYQIFEEITATNRWQRIATAGGATQRPLWASTGVKDKAYDPAKYVVELLAPDTVNTMPEGTIHAARDFSGDIRDSISGSYGLAKQAFSELAELGISYDSVVNELERDGIAKFNDAWEALIKTIGAQL
jgi:transaldolase